MKKYTFFAAAALMLAACTNDEMATDGEVALKVNAAISGTVTRASGTDWDVNDQIGISTVGSILMSYSNMPYTWNGGSFAPAAGNIYFQDATETVTFSAYYPYVADATYTGVSTSADNQTAANRPKIDFLFAAGATASKEYPTVDFTGDHAFSHCMSQITIEFIEGADVSFGSGMMTDYTLSGMVLQGSFDTATGVAAVADGDDTDLTIALGNVTATKGTYTTSVIVFPQDVQRIDLAVTVDGQVYYTALTVPQTTVDGETKTGLQPGTNYRFPVTVSKTDLTVGRATINDWTTVTGTGSTALM